MTNIHIENYLNYFYNFQDTYDEIAVFLAPLVEAEADDNDIDIYASFGAGRTVFSNFGTPTSFASSKAQAFKILKKILKWDKRLIRRWQEIQEIGASRMIDALNSPYYNLNQENEVITCNPIELMKQPDWLEREYIKSQVPDYTWRYQRTRGTIYRKKILQGIKTTNIKPF